MIKTIDLTEESIKKLVKLHLKEYLTTIDFQNNFADYLEENMTENLEIEASENIVEAIVEEARNLSEKVVDELAAEIKL